MSDTAEKAKRAREILEEIAPDAVAGIDAAKRIFGARLIYLFVESGEERISIGDGRSWDAIEALPPSARYLKPAEGREEWRDIKEEIFSRDSARDRASGRGHSVVGRGTQVSSNEEMAF